MDQAICTSCFIAATPGKSHNRRSAVWLVACLWLQAIHAIELPADEIDTAKDAPAVQMLVPGFVADTLPLSLTNLNNVRYRTDGTLVALGYDGNLWLARDMDGDGREESVTNFYSNQGNLRGPIGMAILPDTHPLLKSASPAKAKPWGVVVASKGRVTAIMDLDGDDVAETEQVIATGWQEIPQNVDAVGVAIHPVDHSIYFCLGTAAYNNAYLLDDEGHAKFDLQSERGTIQRLEADLSERTTVCTGIRFAVAMEFDEYGQLLVTEQEGATWLPNGNPFDELLHIVPGKHYGFPPRHPRHLPNVFDQPSLFDYKPQHQSTCGMIVNRPVAAGQPTFGPSAWRNDLFVCGESRGKLYRTHLVRDASNRYVAENSLIACLGLLTVDCCVSPRGDLIVACHSGGPDWGTGPTGPGTVYRIRYTQPTAPQPIACYATGSTELCVEFDRELDLSQMRQLALRCKITGGPYVAAADRFETIRPGYAITAMQQKSEVSSLPVHAASVAADKRSLLLSTDAHASDWSYALTMLAASDAQEDPASPSTAIDLAYSLAGVRAEWLSADGQRSWSGWLPHWDLDIARQLLRESTRAAEFWPLLSEAGTLKLSTQLSPAGWLRPTVQPGGELDYVNSDDPWIVREEVRLNCNLPFRVTFNKVELTSARQPEASSAAGESAGGDIHQLVVPLPSHAVEYLSLQMEVVTSGQPLSTQIQWQVEATDGTRNAGTVALERFRLPWVSSATGKVPDLSRSMPELAGANWGRGRQVFLSEQAACSKCHRAHGSGALIGPDLANLIHRDYASVYRDITRPSFAMNPDYITHQVLTEDGRVLVGALTSFEDKLTVADSQGKLTELARDEIVQMQASAASIMPEGLLEKIGSEQARDLMAFLLLPPPQMSGPMHNGSPAKPMSQLETATRRTREEIQRVLRPAANAAGAELSDFSTRPLRVLLVAGKKDHGDGEHDYPRWLDVWSQYLSAASDVLVDTAMEWPTDEQILAADTIVFYQRGAWNAERAELIDAHLARGRGLVYIHWAIEAGPVAPEFAQRIGLASNSRQTQYRHGPLELGFEPAAGHPIARNFEQLNIVDESYWDLLGDAPRVRVLANAVEDGELRPLFWVMQVGEGRVFVSILGHYSTTFDDPLFRVLLLRGTAWSAQQSVDRFDDLIWLGVP